MINGHNEMKADKEERRKRREVSQGQEHQWESWKWFVLSNISSNREEKKIWQSYIERLEEELSEELQSAADCDLSSNGIFNLVERWLNSRLWKKDKNLASP